MLTASACVSNPADSCRYHSDCQRDGKAGVCAANGFCERECMTDTDCPCGSFCASSCGICLTDDLAAPATCFAQERGLASDEVISGACRGTTRPVSERPEDAGAQICEGGPLPAPVCEADAGPAPELSLIHI